MRAYPNVTRRHIGPAEYGLERLQHMGFFRDGAQPIWRETIAWLNDCVVGRCRAEDCLTTTQQTDSDGSATGTGINAHGPSGSAKVALAGAAVGVCMWGAETCIQTCSWIDFTAAFCRICNRSSDYMESIMRLRSETMDGENLREELEPGVIALGAVYFGILLVLVAWLAA